MVAQAAGGEVVDPRPAADPELRRVFEAYPHIGKVLPAVGYGPAQLAALERTINAAPADAVVSATPLDLARLIRIDKPVVRARYEFAETGEPLLSAIVDAFVARIARRASRS
jgi:predicted GTPase